MNRTACRQTNVSDNLALSDVLLIIDELAQIIEQNSENHVDETSAPSLSTATGRDVSAPEESGDSPLPSLVANIGRQLISQALLNAPGLMSKPPVPPILVKPTQPTGSTFQRGAGTPISLLFPRSREPPGSKSPPALPARLNGGQKRTR